MRVPAIKWGVAGNRKEFRQADLHKCIPQQFHQQRVGETVVNAVKSVGETFRWQKVNYKRRIRQSAHRLTRPSAGNPGFCEYFMAPPIDFGTVWRHVGTHRRYGHDLALWLCDEHPQSFSDAYRGARAEMTAAGFSWTDRGHDRPSLCACWWDTGLPYDADALRVAADRAVANAASSRDEQARREAERLAAEVTEVAPAAALIRRHLEDMLRERPWALGRRLSEARELIAMESWTRHGLWAADRYLSNARVNIERANERLGRVPPAVWFARAADPDVRAAALSACRILSSLDTDWAAVRNSAGWSQATTWTGHVLSEREVLDQGEASHTLGLLHGHRRQLPDPLCELLFGAAPTRRRRPAPSDAPSLGL